MFCYYCMQLRAARLPVFRDFSRTRVVFARAIDVITPVHRDWVSKRQPAEKVGREGIVEIESYRVLLHLEVFFVVCVFAECRSIIVVGCGVAE
jgi:hypothetical protein